MWYKYFFLYFINIFCVEKIYFLKGCVVPRHHEADGLGQPAPAACGPHPQTEHRSVNSDDDNDDDDYNDDNDNDYDDYYRPVDCQGLGNLQMCRH